MANRSKKLVVKRDTQSMEIWEGEKMEVEIACITGTSVYPTPTGKFQVYKKAKDYHSKKYDAPMPHSMFFYKGCAIHAADAVMLKSTLRWAGLAEVGTHGCVSVSHNAAKTLYDWAPLGTPVIVKGAVAGGKKK